MQHKSHRVIGCTRWPGITRAAKDFGVNRIHLYRVLAGQRRDLRGFRQRYTTWRRTHGL